MSEFFITARSFAAPFVSDESTAYVEAASPQVALEQFAASYRHPAGLYAAEAWVSADAYHKGGDDRGQWLSNHEQAKQRLTADLPGYSYRSEGPGRFEVNGEHHEIPEPTAGSVVKR